MTMTATLAYSQKSTSGQSGNRFRMREVYLVEGIDRSAYDNPLEASGIPEVYDESTTLFRGKPLICVSAAAEYEPELESRARVTVEYVEDPEYLPVEVSFFTSHKTKAAWRAARAKVGGNYGGWEDDKLIRNSAGDLYNPPLTNDAPLLRMEVVKRVMNYNLDVWNLTDYVLHTNEVEFRVAYTDGNRDKVKNGTFKAGTMFLSDVRATEVREPYYHKVVTYCFEIDPDGWTKKVPDIGPRCRDANDELGFPRNNGVLINGLVLLDGQGHQLDVSSADPEDFIENEFEIQGKADFRDLDIFNWG